MTGGGKNVGKITRIGRRDTSEGRAGGMPDLLTQEEAIRVLRLDQLGLRFPKESLRYLRRTGQLGFVRVAGKILIPRDELTDYLERQRVKPLD